MATKKKTSQKKPTVTKAAVVEPVYEKVVKLPDFYIVRSPQGNQYVTKDIEHFARVHGFTVKSMKKLGWEVQDAYTK